MGNLTLLLNQMNETIQQLNNKVPAQPPINSGPGQPQVQAAQNQQ